MSRSRIAFIVRTFLEDNKIYFEILVATSLSFMAIYVSIQANKIADSQTKIMEQENLPHIEVKTKSKINDSTKIADFTALVFNRGGKLTNLDVRFYTFIEVESLNGIDTVRLELPIDNFWNPQQYLTGDSEDLIFWVDNMQSNVKAVQLRDSLSTVDYYVEISSYAEISYMDIFDKNHTEYYNIRATGTRMKDEEGIRYKEFYENPAKKILFFPHIKASDLKKMIGK